MSEGALIKRFIEPPFSVLNARSKRWQDRKRAWIERGIQSELGRSVETYDRVSKWINTHIKGGHAPRATRSVFDPVLCELIYRWFCPKGGVVIDPFAGGSVRGLVAALLGIEYYGIELSGAQVEENRRQAGRVCGGFRPEWIIADSFEALQALEGLKADLVFSCPPYWNLERYSTDARDLSNLPWSEFLFRYREIVSRACALLKPDRFAVFVVANIRDKRGCYVDLVGETVRAFEDCGLRLYNDAVLVTVAGTAPVRVPRHFGLYRKMARTHQNVLIFCKGETQRASATARSGLEATEHSGSASPTVGRTAGHELRRE